MSEAKKEDTMAKIAAWANSEAGKLAMAKIQEVLETFKKKLEDNKTSQEDSQKKVDM